MAMKTAIEFSRMRDKGRLFVCREHGMSDVGPNGNALLIVFAPPDTVQMGFVPGNLSTAILAEIAKDAWLKDSGYRGTGNFLPATRPEERAVVWPQWLGSRSFLFHRPTRPLLTEFEEVPGYLRQLKHHKLQKRYNKPSDSPQPPRIFSLVDAIPREWNQAECDELLGHVADRCAFTTFWPSYGGGFGEHFYLFPCQDGAEIPWLRSLAQAFECDFETVTEDQIPCW